MEAEALKQAAASAALKQVRSGMRLGLGSGSTSAHFIRLLGEKLRQGDLQDILGVPTSLASAELARQCQVPVVNLSDFGVNPRLDLAVDGADEVDPKLNLIKGLGKALLREKFIESYADRLLIIVDEKKLVPRLGQGPLPVEIVPFETRLTLETLARFASAVEPVLDAQGCYWRTDNGNHLAHLYFEDGIDDPYRLGGQLLAWPGVVEHGLFLDMADEVIVARSDGIHHITREG